MKTEEKLGNALKELMVNEPLDSISVKRLALICGINRQTFYYHFRDLYDLLTWIFLNEKVEEVEKANNWDMVFVSYLNYIEKNYVFIQNVLNSNGADLVKDFLFNGVYSKFLRTIAYEDVNNVLSVEDRKFIARYNSAGTLYIMSSWVADGMRESKDLLRARFYALTKGSGKEFIKEFGELYRNR